MAKTRRHRKLCKTLNKHRRGIIHITNKLCKLKKNKTKCARLKRVLRCAKRIRGPTLCKLKRK